jgi:uncharacterized protein (DUF2267 family)
MRTGAFYDLVMETLELDDRAKGRAITAAVLQALRDRLTAEEARQARAQLPRPLKQVWDFGRDVDQGPVRMHRRAFYARVQAEAALGSEREARDATLAVFAALKEQLSPGEADDIAAQLPKDLKEIWATAQQAA